MTRAKPFQPSRYSAAAVIFSGRTDLAALRVLKPGFRHCFAIVQVEDAWLLVEPLAHRMDVSVLPHFPEAILVATYRRLGLRVVPVAPKPVIVRPALLRPFTCVEAVKRLLGLRMPLIVTPWQLYRALKSKI